MNPLYKRLLPNKGKILSIKKVLTPVKVKGKIMQVKMPLS
jgi:hypothetical protein